MTRRHLRFCALTLILLACAAALPGQQQDPGAAQTFTLKGTVVNAITGESIRRALVQVNGTQKAMLTGRDGAFEFSGLPQGTAVVLVKKPGYFGSPQAPVRTETVQVGPETEPVVLRLTPESVITGHVEDENGDPVEGAAVELIGRGRKKDLHAECECSVDRAGCCSSGALVTIHVTADHCLAERSGVARRRAAEASRECFVVHAAAGCSPMDLDQPLIGRIPHRSSLPKPLRFPSVGFHY